MFKILVIPVFYLIALIPFWLLYPISTFFYGTAYYIVGYRKLVVLENLRRSFPEKTEKEIQEISKQFYRHFCDVIFESIKLLTISKAEFKKRCSYNDEALITLQRFFDKKQSIVGVMGHCGNWEWAAIAHQFYFNSLITGVYHPFSNKSFDTFMLKLRSRMGGQIIPMNTVYKQLVMLREKNIPTTLGLISDQAPPPERSYWTQFLHQDTAFYHGAEKIAKKFNYPVFYLGVKKIKRGYYSLHVELITEHPNELADGEITKKHACELEKDLIAQPFNWLWTHRRWKHKRPSEYSL